MKVIVIGGGASGLVAAIYASKNNEVTIIDKNEKLGKKILVTGNGRCNYFNSDMSIKNYNSNNIELLDQIINQRNIDEVLNLFDKLGIIPNIKEGYYYPYSNQAVSIQNTLIKELDKVNVKLNTEILDIEYKYRFNIKTNNGTLECDKLIISTGSKVGSKADGVGYKIAKKFNHTIIDIKPALVGLKGNENYYKEWNGIRTNVELSFQGEKEKGEIQLTNYGISGICVMNLSSKILNNNNKKLFINFIPFLNIKDYEEFKIFLQKRKMNLKNRNISELLDGFLNYKLVNIILKISKIDNKEKPDNIKNLELLYKNLTQFEFEVKTSNGLENAQTCSGGIPLNEINLKTMESLKQRNLYFTGELLDVDGKCGGYNLGFAWITGYLAGSNLND